MIYHILPGDAQVAEFGKAAIDGRVIVCREALIAGPVGAESIDEFWKERARFILTEYGEDEILYYEKVADELNLLTEIEPEDEVNLWFEYELFCSVNMWFCLSLLRETGATVYRVEPLGLDECDRWDGFGKMEADDLKACFELRTGFTDEEIETGAMLWDAYRHGEHSDLRSLARKSLPCFPHLKEVAAAAFEQEIRPLETLKAIKAGGETDFDKIFSEFKKRDGVYGYGDLQVQRLLDQLSS